MRCAVGNHPLPGCPVLPQVWWQKPRGSQQLFTVPQPFSFEERQQQRQLAEEAALYLDHDHDQGQGHGQARGGHAMGQGLPAEEVGDAAGAGRWA